MTTPFSDDSIQAVIDNNTNTNNNNITSSPGGQDQNSTLAANPGPADESLKQKKKRKKKKGGKGKTLPTGFEENFTEAPLTVDEFNQDKDFYSQDKPVAERIETAVQKYKAKRKFNDVRHQLLEAYLFLGGINTGAKMFGGVDQKFINDNEADDIARYKATDYVPEKLHNIGAPGDVPEYTVDFDYVVRGFLTHRVPTSFCLKTPEAIEVAVSLVRNFINFIIYHNVCPEYADNLNSALKTCAMASKELPICALLSDKLPGNFNKACSTLFGGYWSLMMPQKWENLGDGTKKIEPGYSKEQAMEVYRAGLLELAELLGGADENKVAKEVHKEDTSLRVVSVWLPEPGSPLKLGRIICEAWTPEGSQPIETRWNGPGELTLYCEKVIAQYAYSGMCLGCTVHELDNGLKYFDEITGVMCSQFLEIRDEKELEVDSDDFDFD